MQYNKNFRQEQVEKLANMELTHVKSDMHLDFDGKFLELPIIVDEKEVVEGVLCNRYGGFGYVIAPSPQAGCCVKCDFCDMSNLPYKGNLSAEVILEQIALVLNRAIKFGYKVTERPLKISFVKGGEGLLNPEFPRALELIAENLEAPIKVSTTFPDRNTPHKVYKDIERFASTYPEVTQMQISLISTNEEYRQSRVKVPLIPFKDLRKYGESWKEKVPNPRKMTLTFTLTENTPCDPKEICAILPPDYFAVRIRDWMPTLKGIELGLLSPTERKVYETSKKFEDYGYQMIPGKPGGTERKFKLTAGHIIKMYNQLVNRNNNL